MTSTFYLQASALIRKNAVQQRRAVKTNICLISAPLIFCIFLWGMQSLVLKLILASPNYHVSSQSFSTTKQHFMDALNIFVYSQCGCQCLSCCITNNEGTESCSSLETGFCDSDNGFTCTKSNESNCGVQFSSDLQAVWCEIPHPSSWPPVMKARRSFRVALISTSDVGFMNAFNISFFPSPQLRARSVS
jgi:hypothetical protein